MKRILITGAFGLVGSDLVIKLAEKYGKDNLVLLSHKTSREVPYLVENADIRDKSELGKIIQKHKINEIYHLAGLLSVAGEKNPELAWDINVNGLRNILDLSVKYKCKVFWPSSIAVFGPTTPKIKTPQHTILEPSTIYGATKVIGELLCQYYFQRYGLDVRSLRYPGLIGYKAPPGDGTTEYSVHIFYSAIKNHSYTCFLGKNSMLPMMFIDDAVKGTLDLMEADSHRITIRTSYNFAAINFAPIDLVSEIQKIMTDFKCTYKPDERQKIADSWPRSINDSTARSDWGWKNDFNLSKMTKIMFNQLLIKLGESK
jgi:nucleoside-diphosphate-sugar epimerase